VSSLFGVHLDQHGYLIDELAEVVSMNLGEFKARFESIVPSRAEVRHLRPLN